MAEKTTVRLLLALAALQKWKMKHLEIQSAYFYERYKHDRPVYIMQHPRFDSSFAHLDHTSVLLRNLYGTLLAGNIYFAGLGQFLKKNEYKQNQAGPYLFSKTNEEFPILFSYIPCHHCLSPQAQHDRLQP